MKEATVDTEAIVAIQAKETQRGNVDRLQHCVTVIVNESNNKCE